MRKVDMEMRWRWVIHALHRGKRNGWYSRWFCFVCAHRRFEEWRQEWDAREEAGRE